MRIVVTGENKTGKSTLSRKLADLLQAEYKHFSRPPVKAFSYFSEVFEDRTRKHQVVDRWCEGDRVYAEGMGHERRLTDYELDELLKRAEAEGLVYIFCWDKDSEVQRRFKEDGETFVPPEKVGRIQSLFYHEAKRLASQYTFPVIAINNFTNSAEILSYGNNSGANRSLIPHIISGIAPEGMGKWKPSESEGDADQGASGRGVPGGEHREPVDSDPGSQAELPLRFGRGSV